MSDARTTEWRMFAQKRHGEFEPVGSFAYADRSGTPDPVPVVVTVVADGDPSATHWGWVGAHATRPVMIRRTRAAFDAQFTFSPDTEAEVGKGTVVRLRVTGQPDSPAAVQPGRLLEAREYLGVTSEQVTSALGWEPGTLGRLEDGGTTITGEQLCRLSRLYRRPVAWFSGESRFEPDPGLLRKLEGQSEHDRAEVLAFAEFLQGAGPAPVPERAKEVTDD